MGNPIYGKDADINGDDVVDLLDAVIVAHNFTGYKDFVAESEYNPAITAEGKDGYYSGYFKGGEGVKIEGDLEVTGKGNFFELCIQGNCKTFWPTGGDGAGGFHDCEIVECSALASWGSAEWVSCSAKCPSDKWLVAGGAEAPIPG